MKFEKEEEEEEETKFNVNIFNEWVIKQEKSINEELFKKYFNFQRPSDMFRYLYQTNDKEKKSQ